MIQFGQSAIHRALFCQDIAEAIFSHLSLPSVIFRSHRDYPREHHDKVEQRANRHALASAARVSKFVSEVALSVLWAQIESLRRLVRLLPQYDPALRRLDGEPTDADWSNFEKYAAFVREAYLLHAMYSEEDLWNIVLNHYQSVGRFLPRLTALATLHLTPAEDSLSDFFLRSHTLRHISIDLGITGYSNPSDGGAPPLTVALERIATAIPSLSSLTISFVSFTAPEYPQISWEVPSFESMRKLDIMSRLTADASRLATIGQFQYLYALSVHIGDHCAHLHGCFQALTELNISGCASHIQSFLAATSPPLLRSLTLFFMHDPSTHLLPECMSALPASVPTTLSALTLVSNTVTTFDSAMDIIQPALAFRALAHFRFKFGPLPSLSDDDILTMLSAWPALTTLRIQYGCVYDHRGPSPPRIWLIARVFLLIVARCPRLHTLELLEVDLAATPPLDALPPPLGHPLRALDLQSGCADRHACMRAAVMLDRLFPFMKLPEIRGDGCEERDENENGWDAVVRLLDAMQAGRAHADAFERAWGG